MSEISKQYADGQSRNIAGAALVGYRAALNIQQRGETE